AQHDRFVEKVQNVEYKFRQGHHAIAHDLFDLLRYWLIRHIQESDAEYVPALLQLGMTKSWVRKFW
ncbi:MAG: hypothetical protein LBS89_07160, partial [Zoogloeaceae bacterium]|nr:hypothetical protein [Zoogloeaceae bacterium]